MYIQAAYSVGMSSAVALLTVVSYGKAFRPAWRAALVIVAGLAIGLYSPVLAASYAFTAIILSIFPKQEAIGLGRRWHFVLFSAVTGFAAAVSHLSSGTQARSQVVAEAQDALGVANFEPSDFFSSSIELGS